MNPFVRKDKGASCFLSFGADKHVKRVQELSEI